MTRSKVFEVDAVPSLTLKVIAAVPTYDAIGVSVKVVPDTEPETLPEGDELIE